MQELLTFSFSDFQVNEIDSSGHVVELKDLQTVPEKAMQAAGNANSNQEALNALTQLIGQESVEKLKTLMDDTSAKVLLPPLEPDSKETRTKLHQSIRSCFGGKLDSKTLDGGIEVAQVKKGGQTRTPQKDWKTLGGEYCQFTLYKENKDSHDALGVLSKLVGINVKSFGIAGTKDKRAVTCQLATLHKTSADQLKKLNSRLKGIQLGNFQYVAQPKQLGDLWGNRFVVVMRYVFFRWRNLFGKRCKRGGGGDCSKAGTGQQGRLHQLLRIAKIWNFLCRHPRVWQADFARRLEGSGGLALERKARRHFGRHGC